MVLLQKASPMKMQQESDTIVEDFRRIHLQQKACRSQIKRKREKITFEEGGESQQYLPYHSINSITQFADNHKMIKD